MMVYHHTICTDATTIALIRYVDSSPTDTIYLADLWFTRWERVAKYREPVSRVSLGLCRT